MQKFMKWIAASVLVVTAAGVLTGCYVETRPRYHRVIVVR